MWRQTFQIAADTDSQTLLFGAPILRERVLDLEFAISPSAFFQTNTPATDKLYSLVAEWCALAPDGVLMDVCCGTGAIGLCVACQPGQKQGRVVGVDLVEAAIEDAKANARRNGCGDDRAMFVAGKAEETMQQIVNEAMQRLRHRLPSSSSSTTTLDNDDDNAETAVLGSTTKRLRDNEAETEAPGETTAKRARLCTASPDGTGDADLSRQVQDSGSSGLDRAGVEAPELTPPAAAAIVSQLEPQRIVAVLDPPRAGLHRSVLKSLLRCRGLDRVVYVSCNINSFVNDATVLCVPPSSIGSDLIPFRLVRVRPVDLFPHTPHCEVVALFERDTTTPTSTLTPTPSAAE